MKKQLVIIGIIAMFSSIWLSGCDQKIIKEDDDKLENYNLPPQYPTVTLNGWYYVNIKNVDAYGDPLKNRTMNESDTYEFYINEGSTGYLYSENTSFNEVRIIADKVSSGQLFITISKDSDRSNRYAILYNLQTINSSINHLDERLNLESESYYIWSDNGTVTVTVLQNFTNFNISGYGNANFIKYNSD